MAIYKENEYKEAVKRMKQKIAELEIEMGAVAGHAKRYFSLSRKTGVKPLRP